MAVSREHLQGYKSSLHFVREISSEEILKPGAGEANTFCIWISFMRNPIKSEKLYNNDSYSVPR